MSVASRQPAIRNLVVCIDGTENQFGVKNTNVIELYGQLVNNKDQLTYYNSGIGTYAGHDGRLKRMLKAVPRKVESMVAKKMAKIVQRAYRWLAENYQEGDCIYFFGFSRGAYAVRILAAIIKKVGLICKGNEEQIPFAYTIYEDPTIQVGPTTAQRQIFQNKDKNQTAMTSAEVFKETFGRDIPIHFVGVWDTVSAIGVVRRDDYPGTNNPHTACHFRHALALDERRVKFLPEYAWGGKGAEGDEHVKEVWFSGTHSDIGGGNIPNLSLNNGPAPLVWMLQEARDKGVRLDQTKLSTWNTVGPIRPSLGLVHESLRSFWKLFEYLPIKRRSYIEHNSLTRRLHQGQGRPMQYGQRVHISVALFYQDQLPRATLPEGSHLQWKELENLGSKWDNIIEIDSLAVGILVVKIAEGGDDLQRYLNLLTVMTNLDTGRKHFQDDPPAVLSLFNMMKEEHEGHEVISRALDRIGNVKRRALYNEAIFHMMKETIGSSRIENVIIFLHKHDLMFTGFAQLMYPGILSSAVSIGTYDIRRGAMNILTTIATVGGNDSRSDIARTIGKNLILLLKNSKNWEEGFDDFQALLEVLAGDDIPPEVTFGDVRALFQTFKGLASSEDEVPGKVCEYCMRIFGIMLASVAGRRFFIDEGKKVFLNDGFLVYLLQILTRGNIDAVVCCFCLFDQLLASEDVRDYTHITDKRFQIPLFVIVSNRNNALITEKFLFFLGTLRRHAPDAELSLLLGPYGGRILPHFVHHTRTRHTAV